RRPRRGVALLVDFVHAQLLAILLVQALRPERKKTRRRQMLRLLDRIARRQEVARDLLADELIVRLVRVERGDDVVSIPPRFGKGEVALLAGALGEARHVQPVPAPAL